MSASATKPETVRTGLRCLAVGSAVAVAELAGIVLAVDAVGYGHDLHALRVAATIGVLATAMVVLVWPNQPRSIRGATVVVALVLAATAWWLVPTDFGGRSLREAAAQRDAMTAWLDSLPPDDVQALPRIRESLDSLAADYPTLCADVRTAVDRRIAQVVAARGKELRELPASDAAGFTKTAPARTAVVKAFPEAKPELVAAEAEWATRWARYTAALYVQADLTPAYIRLGCRESEEQLLGLPTLDDSPDRLLEARRVFFRAAHETTEKEVATLHKNELFDRAFTIAHNHKLDWARLFGLLMPDERALLDALVSRCESLKPKGDATQTETAPVPRSKDGGDTP